MEIIETFKKYFKSGLACLPTGPDKMPAIPKGSSWKGGWIDTKEYQTSFGIGLLAGKASGNLECIDFDNKFGDAKQVLQDFSKCDGVKEIVDKYKLPIQSTTSGGYHLLYRCDLIEGNQKLASRPKEENGRIKPIVLIETRGEGGYFIVDPTPGYKLLKNDFTKINYITAEDRAILLSACRSFNKNVKVYNKPEEDKDKPGDIFNSSIDAIPEMIISLKHEGWKELREGIWRRPGKDKGISATLGKAAPGIFYNFSSSGAPFESEKGYTAFQVIALLKYNGDFKRFAKELHEKYNTSYKQEIKVEEPKNEKQFDEILKKAFIDLEIPVARPPIILRIKSLKGIEYVYNRVLTLGNFSAVIGKSKAKKTFLTSMLLASMTKNDYYDRIFQGTLPTGKSGVVLFDTEQSTYDAYVSALRVWTLAGGKYSNFGAFDLREYNPLDRCNIIDTYLKKAGDRTGYIVIDGIADLANAINDEIEASRVVSMLMKWTKVYNTHITVVIHQNKNDNFATGHLGSSIMKKSECIMSVTKDVDDNTKSKVECDFIRGISEFDSFNFFINNDGLPSVEFANKIQPEDPFMKL
jgi:hypothetical protein